MKINKRKSRGESEKNLRNLRTSLRLKDLGQFILKMEKEEKPLLEFEEDSLRGELFYFADIPDEWHDGDNIEELDHSDILDALIETADFVDEDVFEDGDRKKQNKHFRDNFEILNKIKIDYNINLSSGVIKNNKKTYDKNDPNLNQVLKYKDLITSQVLELEYSPNTALEEPEAFEFDCRALKR